MTEATPCSITGCNNVRRSATSDWCEKHYMRWYRHGHPSAGVTIERFSISRGRRYRSVYLPSHPLATKRGQKAVAARESGYWSGIEQKRPHPTTLPTSLW